MKNNQTPYRVIGFGTNDHGFFNAPRCFSKPIDAIDEYVDFMHDPEMDGAVLLKVNHESWRVDSEFGTDGYCVVVGPGGNYKVMKAPQIEIDDMIKELS